MTTNNLFTAAAQAGNFTFNGQTVKPLHAGTESANTGQLGSDPADRTIGLHGIGVSTELSGCRVGIH